MNQFTVAGRILAVGERHNPRSPFPVLLETAVARDKTALVQIDAYPPKGGEFVIGAFVLFAGHLESREWNGKRFLKLAVTQTTLLPPGERPAMQPVPVPQPPPPPYPVEDEPPPRPAYTRPLMVTGRPMGPEDGTF